MIFLDKQIAKHQRFVYTLFTLQLRYLPIKKATIW